MTWVFKVSAKTLEFSLASFSDPCMFSVQLLNTGSKPNTVPLRDLKILVEHISLTFKLGSSVVLSCGMSLAFNKGILPGRMTTYRAVQ